MKKHKKASELTIKSVLSKAVKDAIDEAVFRIESAVGCRGPCVHRTCTVLKGVTFDVAALKYPVGPVRHNVREARTRGEVRSD